MPLDPSADHSTGRSGEFSWDASTSLLYALAVGAGADDPTQSELEFTTENSTDVTQRALPTMAVTLGNRAGTRPDYGSYDLANLVHGEQSLTLHQPVPTSGTAVNTPKVGSIIDKGSAAVVEIENDVSIEGEPLWTSRSSLFIRGEGGFGGGRSPSAGGAGPVPDRPAEHVTSVRTRPDQALLYRLTGDRNPLHSDPVFARRAGFERPILHGLCTFGFVGRVLLRQCCGDDPDLFHSISCRFSAPVLPGQPIDVLVWDEGPRRFRFQASVAGTVVLDRGVLTTR